MRHGGILHGMDRALRALDTLFLTLAAACIAVMLAINIANLLIRNILGWGIIWVWPWTGVLLVWAVFLGFFVLYRRRMDVSVEYLVDRMPPSGKRWLRILGNLCGIAVTALIVLETGQILQRQAGIMDYIGLDRFVLSIPLIASSALILLSLVIDSVVTFLNPEPPAGNNELPRWSL